MFLHLIERVGELRYVHLIGIVRLIHYSTEPLNKCLQQHIMQSIKLIIIVQLCHLATPTFKISIATPTFQTNVYYSLLITDK